MNLRPALLVAEDLLGLALGRRLIQEVGNIPIFREENGHGYGNLKAQVQQFDQMARAGLPVLLLTDLDRIPCVPELLADWMGPRLSRLHPNFLLRVCVRTAESWVMADPETLAPDLGLRPEHLPMDPDSIAAPKTTLLNIIARRSPGQLKRRLLPAVGSSAAIGPEYNPILVDFVAHRWRPDVAANRSPSLKRALPRLAALARAYRRT